MKYYWCAIIFFSTILIYSLGNIQQVFAQESMPAASPAPQPTPSFNDRVEHIESELIILTEKVELYSNTSNRTLDILIGMVSVIVGIATIASTISYIQNRSDENRSRPLDEQREKIEILSVNKVNEVMNVVQQTLESRLMAEKKESELREKAEKNLKQNQDEIGVIKAFIEDFQKSIEKKRKRIEDNAHKIFKENDRHGFGKVIVELGQFANELADFEESYMNLESTKQEFSLLTTFTNGIAAYFYNKPEIAHDYLNRILSADIRDSDTDKFAFDRIKSDAAYFLGLNEENYGHHDRASKFFMTADAIYPSNKDYLSKIVLAQALISEDASKAKIIIDEVLDNLESSKNKNKDQNFTFDQGNLYKRAKLIDVNIHLINKDEDWLPTSLNILTKLTKDYPKYYYGLVTYAQLLYLNKDEVKAKTFFKLAYDEIKESDDLIYVKEKYSRILLLMTTALCLRQNDGEKNEIEKHLNEARSLVETLPEYSSKKGTVFSVLSKKRTEANALFEHMENISSGKVIVY